jgi:hypothetical protein
MDAPLGSLTTPTMLAVSCAHNSPPIKLQPSSTYRSTARIVAFLPNEFKLRTKHGANAKKFLSDRPIFALNSYLFACLLSRPVVK